VSQPDQRRRRTSGGETQVIRDPEKPAGPITPVRVVPDNPVEMPDSTAQAVQSQHKKAKAKPVRTAPAGVPIPMMGFPALLYKMRVKFRNRPDLVPLPYDRELVEIEIRNLEAWLLALANVPGLQITVSVINTKGGASKTTITINVGSLITNVTRKVGIVLPATTSTSTSTAAMVAGIEPEDTLTITKFASKWAEFGNFAQLSQLVKTNKFGLRVIAEDPVKDIGIGNTMKTPTYLNVKKTVEDNSDLRILDHGNDDPEIGSVVLEAARGSDVIVFTATADNPVTLRKLSDSLRLYQSDEPLYGDFDESVPEHVRISTRKKVEKGIVVISRVADGEDPASYRQYYNHTDIWGNQTSNSGFAGTYLTVREDPYIGDINNVVADLDKVDRTTYRDLAKIAVSWYITAGKQRKMKLPDPPPELQWLWELRKTQSQSPKRSGFRRR
jgi:hypothetical protein